MGATCETKCANKVAGARTRSGRGSGLSHSVSGRLALDGGWAGAAGGRVGAPVLEYGEGEHREVDAVEARAHDAEVLEDELEHVEQVAGEAATARRDGEEELGWD